MDLNDFKSIVNGVHNLEVSNGSEAMEFVFTLMHGEEQLQFALKLIDANFGYLVIDRIAELPKSSHKQIADKLWAKNDAHQQMVYESIQEGLFPGLTDDEKNEFFWQSEEERMELLAEDEAYENLTRFI